MGGRVDWGEGRGGGAWRKATHRITAVDILLRGGFVDNRSKVSWGKGKLCYPGCISRPGVMGVYLGWSWERDGDEHSGMA